MPLVRIDLFAGRSDAEVRALSHAVHRALVECLNVPERDRFQLISEHHADRLVYDPAYLGVEWTDRVVFVQVVLTAGRSVEQKQPFYTRAAERIAAEAHMRPEDVTIVLVENKREHWSFGNGVAQYLSLPRSMPAAIV